MQRENSLKKMWSWNRIKNSKAIENKDILISLKEGKMIKNDSGAQSINRALQILETIADHNRGLTISELVEELKLNKSTIHRILQTFVEWGYVVKDDKSKRYRLGMKVIDLGYQYLGGLELKTEALPFLEILQQQTGQFAHLALLVGDEVVYLEKIGPHTHPRMYSQIGKKLVIHSSGLGKVIFANLNETMQQALIKKMDFHFVTDRTIRTAVEFLREIEKTKVRGYAIDDEENELGMRCVAAPIFDYTGKVIGAVSTSGYIGTFNSQMIEKYAEYTKVCAKGISAQMGYRE